MGDIGKADDLDSLIKHSQFPSDALFLVELLPQEAVVKPAERQNLLRFAHFDPEIAFAQYTSGRIFHETFELRWEQTDNGKIRVVYLGTTEGDLPGLHPVEGDLARNEQPEYYYLFGIRVKEDDLKKHKFPVPEGESIFTEGRIPHSSILVSWRLMYWQKHPSLSLTLVLSRVMSEGQRSSSKTNEVNISSQVVLSKGCCVRLWKHLAMAVSHSSMGTMSRSIEMGG